MESGPIRPWYKKKRYLIPLGIAALLTLSAFANPPSPTPSPATPLYAPQNLSNDNYYTNSDGVQVHAPAYAPSVPVGATAQCGDGTYSFSQHRSGTCSHHGGVAEWL